MIKTFVDIVQLKERTGNDEKLIVELLEILKTELINYKQEIDVAHTNNNYNELKSIFHKLKSAVGIFGFSNVFDRLDKIEEELKKNNKMLGIDNEINIIFNSVNKHIVELENLMK